MAHGGAEAQHVLGQGPGVGEAERLADALAQHVVPALAGQLLQHAPGDAEAGVAVGLGDAQGMVLGQVGAGFDVLLHAVVAAPGVEEQVAVDAAGVGEQMPDRHLLGDLGVGHLELGQHFKHRRVEGEPALLDLLHDQGGGVDLGDRADLEERVGGDVDAGGLVQGAGGELVQFSLVQVRQRRARHLVLGDQLGEPLTHCSSHARILSL